MVVWALFPDTWTLYLYGTLTHPLLGYDIYSTCLKQRLTFNIIMDCGTEAGKLAAIYAFLCDNRDDVDDSTDLVIYGPCINQPR